MTSLAERVRLCIDHAGRTQADVAAHVELSESQLSKSLGGTRKFSAVDVARLADDLQVSMHWLLTGEDDPMAMRLAARHSFDPSTGSYQAAGAVADEQVLQDVALLYRQAYRHDAA